MAKAKPVKKPTPSKPLKISTSLFKRRLSKNSTGQLDKEPATPKGVKKGGVKAKSTRKRSISPKEKPKKKTVVAPAATKKGKDGKTKKEKPTSKTIVKGRKKGGNEKTAKASPRAKKRSSSSSSSHSSSNSERSEKVGKRRKTKEPQLPSDEDEEDDGEDQEEEDEEESLEDDEDTEGTEEDGSDSDNESESSGKSKKKPAAVKKKVIAKKGPAKKIVRKVVKRPPVIVKKTTKLEKSSKTSKTKEKNSKTTTGRKGENKKDEKSKGPSSKPKKLKPRPKIKRMASLNATAILEASFSFENQEKRQQSPAPSPNTSPKNKKGSAPQKVIKEESESASPSPSASTFIPIQNLQNKDSLVGVKRKSTDRRESTTSVKSDQINNTSKTGSRKNSSSKEEVQKDKKEKNKEPAGAGKKKIKVSVSTTSTSTGTSPPPPQKHPLNIPPPVEAKKGKKKKLLGVDSGTFTGGESSSQSSGVQSNQHKSAGNQSKERKSSSNVAHFGTIYQPAGPLIEPHKTPSASSGILPETVKLPPDLKVTYQTHPPSSNVPTVAHSSSSSKGSNKKHGGSSTTTTTSHSSHHHHHKSEKGILHQPYKSSSQSVASSSSSSRQSGYSSSSTSTYINPAAATGSPLLLSQSSSAATSLNMPHPGHHSISSQSQQLQQQQTPSASAAPSAGGLFYSTSAAFAPHHSPFAPNKYPMVAPESYRTHSPYQSSFLYPNSAPQQSQQNYFMTPFYTPPLTPNPNPGASIVGGLGSQQRPLSLHHHSITAAPFYAPQSQPVGLPQHPYLVASPHHSQSLQPAAGLPGHAGLFPHNQSTQPACPCPTESCPPNNTNNNKQQQQRLLSTNASLPVLAPKPTKTTATTKTPRPNNKRQPRQQQPPPAPTAVEPPPITIQLLTNPVGVQARQLESAKTFTEQYSLPDDITITPIIVNNPSALLLKNTSISIVPPASSPKNTSSAGINNNKSPATSTTISGKKKEKDIVHVIDPRSGLKTTIAKHISNRNLLAKNSVVTSSSNKKSPNLSTNQNQLKPNIKKIGAVGKLNPDLDVIIINKNHNSGNDALDCDDITENLVQSNIKGKKFPTHNIQQHTNIGKKLKQTNKPLAVGGSGLQQQLPLSQAKAGDNNKTNKKVQKRITLNNKDSSRIGLAGIQNNVPISYSLPPGISISAGVVQNQGLNLSMKQPGDFVQVHSVKQNQQQKGKKRTSLNDCIDELQKKRTKLLEDQHVSGLNYNGVSVNGNNGHLQKKKLPYQNGKEAAQKDLSKTSARVRDPQVHRGPTLINNSDAVAAVKAVVLDHETYMRNLKLGLGPNGKMKNGFKTANKNKVNQSGVGKKSAFIPHQRDLNFVVGMSKVRSGKGSILSTRNTRSAAANSKIRTRFATTKPKGGESARSRSRLLRTKGGNVIQTGNRSDSSSRSNIIVNGHASTPPNFGRSSAADRENRKVPSQSFVNALADFHQYRRTLLLRVPRSGVGVFPCANTVDLEGFTPSSRSSLSPGQEKIKSQLSPLISSQNEQSSASPTRSLSPATVVSTKNPAVGSFVASAAKKRALIKPLSPAAMNGALLQMGLMARSSRAPKWSNGWRFEGEPYDTKVFLNNDDPPVIRRCYPCMRHESGDVIQTRDCVLLKSGSRKNDLPFIAKIAALFENPMDGEMMFSLLWYYRPEHTEMGRAKGDMPDEIFASKHIDVNSVATIDDRCFVLTFSEYCRYRKRLKQLQEGLPNKHLLSLSGSAMVNNAAGNIANSVWSGGKLSSTTETEPNPIPLTPGKISPEVVFFCKKVYDFKAKRMARNTS